MPDNEPWDLSLPDDIPDLYSSDLNELIRKGYMDSDTDRVPVRTFPVGLLSWWRELARKKHVSVSKIQRVSIGHGLSIAFHDPRIKDILKLYAERVDAAKKKHDRLAMKILEEKLSPLTFVNQVSSLTTIGSLKKLEAPLGAMSSALELPESKLLIYLSLLSMETLKDQDWWHMMQEEVDVFWRHVENRKRVLQG